MGLSQKGAAPNGPGDDPLCFETGEASSQLRPAHLKKLYESPLRREPIAHPEAVIRAIFPDGSSSLNFVHLRTFAVSGGVCKSFVGLPESTSDLNLATRSGFRLLS